MRHTPVLLQECIEGLQIKNNGTYVDCNLGDGGHTEAILRLPFEKIEVVGLDLDSDAIARAQEHVTKAIAEQTSGKKKSKKKLHVVRTNFRHIDTALDTLSLKSVDGVLYDLGLSSYELEESGRGFTFRKDEPLQMTFGKAEDSAFTAAQIVNEWDEENLRSIIKYYGEERYAGRIAARIIEARAVAPIKTTSQLADIIYNAVPAPIRRKKIHPATKTFQAIRITVNDELESLSESIPKAFDRLEVGGRMVIISYHSLEDRIVKVLFKDYALAGKGKIITKKPITPKPAELSANPRSRSAKLRIIEKIK